MKLSGSKKILLLGIILLIIAGIVVVALKGVKVSLTLQQHETVKVYIGKKVELKEFKNICKEVFDNKTVSIRENEYFNESFTINLETITDEEKTKLVEKINEKLGTELAVESLEINTASNIRIRDIVKPYFKPVIISTVLIIVYMIIRFRKMSAIKLLAKIFGIIILTEAVIFSIIAITRVPLSPTIINLMAVIAVIELIVYINKIEKKK
ncbi:MAG: hypothetical protein IJW20_06305 [Clostridia bacterium]|nr:hypothetical protein [Clostridia bacterium]